MTGATLEGRERQDELGQFLTPAPVAQFMASMLGDLPSNVRLLDAGAGAGALSHAFISSCCERGLGVRSIEATLYERDESILPELTVVMQECRRRCIKAGIHFTSTIHSSDFILEMSGRIAGRMFEAPPSFNVAIVNPPYRKISADSAERRSLRRVGVETSNLYAGFVALIQELLVEGGQLVAITPRSFCNGPYFRLFRERLLHDFSLQRLHVFESRRAAFRNDSVLQENVIFHAVKGQRQSRDVVVSTSSGESGAAVTEKRVPYTNIVHPGDAGQFIHIPSSDTHELARETMAGLTASLASLGVSVSTGRVVDFRVRDALRSEPGPGTFPLLYACHFNKGRIQWPRLGAKKPNAILDNEQTRNCMVPTGIYLLTKRFTSKEERRRLVACVFEPGEVNAEWLGFENHLNYFHSGGQGLRRDLAAGLFVFLNSTVVDQFFRRFSGHTQVNATDLRALRYPDRATIEAMGREVRTFDLEQDDINSLVGKHLNGH